MSIITTAHAATGAGQALYVRPGEEITYENTVAGGGDENSYIERSKNGGSTWEVVVGPMTATVALTTLYNTSNEPYIYRSRAEQVGLAFDGTHTIVLSDVIEDVPDKEFLNNAGVIVGAVTEEGLRGDVVDATVLKIATVAVTATAAELNKLDASIQAETILVAGAIDPASRVTYLSAASGAYAVTLAAPDASMLGQVKVIEMTVAGAAITLALTEVQGGSAATSASFDAANETLTLVAGSLKWNVVGESGVTLA